MALFAMCEMLVYFDRFRNVDLLEQGYYGIKTAVQASTSCCKHGSPGSMLIVTPSGFKLYFVEPHLDLEPAESDNPRHCLFPGYICPTDNSFHTKTFWVQYMDEEVQISEAARFKLELEANSFVCLNIAHFSYFFLN